MNFFVGRRIKHAAVQELWGEGIVWVKDWTQDSRVKGLEAPLIVAVRLGAIYGCKYASKDWSEEVLCGGAHRYEVAQGYQPDEHAERHATLAEAWAEVHSHFGGFMPTREWSSADCDGWDAPPAYCFTFSEGLAERSRDG